MRLVDTNIDNYKRSKVRPLYQPLGLEQQEQTAEAEAEVEEGLRL